MTSSMEMDLYNMDMSLFDRDVLVGLDPTSELRVTEDVEKSLYPQFTWATDLDLKPSQNELTNSQALSTSEMDDLNISWMDSRVDLLDLLTEHGEYALAEFNVTNSQAVKPENQTQSAVDVLTSIAEETSQMLADGSTELKPEELALAQDIDFSNVEEKSVEVNSVDTLLDMLSSGVDPTVDMDSTFEPMPLDSNILSPVTTEDIESILSSEPSSPVPFSSQELPSAASNSLLAMYLVGELDTGVSSKSMKYELEQNDLEGTLTMFQNDDPDYVPAFQVNKSRSTPYARSKAKNKRSTSADKQARLLERKMRKKQQNKDAATRYRQKKRAEADEIDDECNKLETRNTELRDKVDQMTREISYLKNLLAEVYKARGLMLPKSENSK